MIWPSDTYYFHQVFTFSHPPKLDSILYDVITMHGLKWLSTYLNHTWQVDLSADKATVAQSAMARETDNAYMVYMHSRSTV